MADVPRGIQDWRVADYVSTKKAPPPVEMKVFAFHSSIFKDPGASAKIAGLGSIPHAIPSPGGEMPRSSTAIRIATTSATSGQPTIGRSLGQLRLTLYNQLELPEVCHLWESVNFTVHRLSLGFLSRVCAFLNSSDSLALPFCQRHPSAAPVGALLLLSLCLVASFTVGLRAINTKLIGCFLKLLTRERAERYSRWVDESGYHKITFLKYESTKISTFDACLFCIYFQCWYFLSSLCVVNKVGFHRCGSAAR